MKQIICNFCGDTYPDFDVAHVCSKGPYAPKLKPTMNKRIRNFEVASGLDIFGLGARREMWEAALEKYAKLVVETVLDEVKERAYYTGDRDWSDEVDRPWIQLEFGYGKLHDAKTSRS